MELVSVYKYDDLETSSKYSEKGLDRDTYANKDQKLSFNESRALNHRGLSVGNKCVVLSTVCFGLMCIFLAAAIAFWQRETYKLHTLQSSSRDQMEKNQLQNSFNFLNQKKLELETRVKDLTTETSQLKTRSSPAAAESRVNQTEVIREEEKHKSD